MSKPNTENSKPCHQPHNFESDLKQHLNHTCVHLVSQSGHAVCAVDAAMGQGRGWQKGGWLNLSRERADSAGSIHTQTTISTNVLMSVLVCLCCQNCDVICSTCCGVGSEMLKKVCVQRVLHSDPQQCFAFVWKCVFEFVSVCD